MTGYRPPALIAVAHGTKNPDGIAEMQRLIEQVRRHRPGVRVELCWLERAKPRFSTLLTEVEAPLVVVPLLLCTGHHVKVDIAEAVAGRPGVVVAGQLGPDRRVTDVVADRLRQAHPELAGSDIVLFASGSSDPEAAEQLAAVASQLRQAVDARVHPRQLTDKHWRDGVPGAALVANYLLAPGNFNDQLRAFARELGSDCVAEPIGAHPTLATVVVDRYVEAAKLLPGLRPTEVSQS